MKTPLRAAFLAALDNHLCLVCYPYFGKPDSFKQWGPETLNRFLYIVKEHLKCANVYFSAPSSLPEHWIPEHEDLWLKVLASQERLK